MTRKTGGSVFFDRVPITLLHLAKSEHLITRELLVSDFATTIAGQQVYDGKLSQST
jgi:predicted ATPase